MREPQSIEDNIIYLIGEIARLSHKRVTAIFTENNYDVTVEQFGVLALLWYQEGINQQSVANGLNRDKTTITRIVENMIKKNLIVKIPDQLDKRNKLIFLTEKGRSLQKDMIGSTGKVYMDAINNLSEKEIRTVTTVLQKMKTNLNE
jgi:DNA-binding MarR family transcriptional regulator